MRFPSFFHTSSFRLTLIYAGLSSACFVALWGVVSVSTAGFMARQVDGQVASEITEIEAGADLRDTASLARSVAALTKRSPDFYYLLQDPRHRPLAGNLVPLAPRLGVRTLSLRQAGGRRLKLRGRGVGVPGGYLFVALDIRAALEMRQWITDSFLWGLGVTLLLALAGGVFAGLGLLRRVEQVSLASRAIMAGDFTRRLALGGRYDELDHLATSLNLMLERIEALMAELRQVSTDIAHDLKTPLTRLRQRLERAESQHPVLGACVAEVDQILETFDALLRIAQIESGARRQRFASVDLVETLTMVVELYQPAADAQGQALQSEIAADLRVTGDRELLVQLFANLLENALRHTPHGTRVVVRAARSPKGVRVAIADDGPGVAAALRPLVQQRFFRGDASRTTPGSGLGLAIAAAIAALHGSRLVLEDNHPGLRVAVELG